MSFLFCAVCLAIFLKTGKNLAASASVGFAVAGFAPDLQSYEATITALLAINFTLFIIALTEYSINKTHLSRVLMWLYLSALAVTASYVVTTSVVQGHVLVAMSVIELIALSSLDGCKSLYGDIKLTVHSVRRGAGRALHHDDAEGGK